MAVEKAQLDSFDPEEFHKLAMELTKADGSERSLRTAVGRAYYACHLTARTRLILKNWQPGGFGQDHGRIIYELKTRNKHNLAGQLDALRELREHADYHLHYESDRTNKDCEICKRLREKPEANNVAVVSTCDWTKANDLAKRLLPSLKSL